MPISHRVSVRSPFAEVEGSPCAKPGLLPTPHARFAIAPAFPECAPPPPPPAAPDALEAKGVVCMDRSLVEEGDKTMMIPRQIRVKRVLFDVEIMNSFVDFQLSPSFRDMTKRRMSCPDFGDPQPQEVQVTTPPMVPQSPPPMLEAAAGGVTTYMIRNIPTRFTSITFVRLLEEYGFKNSFNFFYLPMDFRSGKNMGYAFINFLDPEAGLRFVERFHGRRLPVSTSKKVLEISPSRRQGLAENISLFRTSDLLSSVSLPHYKPLISSEKTGGLLVPLSDVNFPPA